MITEINGKIDWEQFEESYIDLLEKRNIVEKFKTKYKDLDNICFLCSEETATNCHRRLLAEFLRNNLFESAKIIHL